MKRFKLYALPALIVFASTTPLVAAPTDFSVWLAGLTESGSFVGTHVMYVLDAGTSKKMTTAIATANTPSSLVARDGSGNFSAGTITATLSGNASTATALASNPTDCSSNQFANAIAGNGNLTCAALTDADIPDALTISGGTINNSVIGGTTPAAGTFTTLTTTATNPANGSSNPVAITSFLGAMDGLDAYIGLNIGIVNADHTGSLNTVQAIGISGITGDANATETAIKIGEGWDTAIDAGYGTIKGGALIAENGFSTVGLLFSVDETGALTTASVGANQISSGYATQAGQDGVQVSLSSSLAAMSGSNEVDIVKIDVTNANHTGASNALNAINIGGITQDAQATETAIKIASGWDAGIDASNNAITTTGVISGGGYKTAYVQISATYTITSSDSTIECTSGTFHVTLPTAVGITGRIFDIKNSGAGVITIDTTSSQTIDGNASGVITLAQYVNLEVQSNGTNWVIR